MASDHEKRAARLQRALETLRRHNPRKIGGRQIFFADLMQKVAEKHPGDKLPRNVRNSVMKQHVGLYQSLPLDARGTYAERAELAMRASREQLASEIERVEAQLDLCRQRRQEEIATDGVQLKIDVFKLALRDMDVLTEMFNSGKYTAAYLAQRVAGLQAPPPVPPAHVRAHLDSFRVTQPPRIHPWWLGRMCHNRADIRLTAFGRDLADGSEFYMFSFALQKPYDVRFLKLRVDEAPLPLWRRMSVNERLQEARDFCLYTFRVENVSHISHDGLPFALDESTLVMCHLSFVSGGYVACHMRPRNFLDWVRDLPDPVSDRGSASDARPSRATSAVDGMDIPAWALRYVGQEHVCADGDVDLTVDGYADDTVGVAFDELTEGLARGELRAASGNDFFIRVRSAASSSSDLAPNECIGAEAKRGIPREWCNWYGLPVSISFSVRKYSAESAFVLASHWCERLQFFYDLWIALSGDLSYRFSEDDFASWKPSDEWLSFCAGLAHGSDEYDRALMLDTLFPSNPKSG